MEVRCEKIEVLSVCNELPFDIQNDINIREEIRQKYRYLDLRRPIMQERMLFRSRFANGVRNALSEKDFLEIETPMLVRSTPEGARDFVVPSRNFPGNFYALPQSPQLYKQLLMIAGADRYYQFARCYRDEDPRRERQLVHTQIDIEMALVTPDDIFSTVEDMLRSACKSVGIEIETPFPRYCYDEVIRRWGIDKPDLRYGMEIVDFSACVVDSGIKIFDMTLENKDVIKGLVAPGAATYSRKKISELEKFVKTFDIKGLVPFKLKEGALQGSMAKKMKPENLEQIMKCSQAKEGDLILLAAGPSSIIHRGLGELRKLLAKQLELVKGDEYNFLWVTDFPLFEKNEETGSWEPMHHMFTMPKQEYLDKLEENPGEVKGDLLILS